MHLMLNTYIYYLLPPTCFDVCCTTFGETIALFAQELYMTPGILIKKRNRVHFTFYSTIYVTKLQKAYSSWTNNAMVSLKMV